MRLLEYTADESLDGRQLLVLLRRLCCSAGIITQLKNNGGLTVNGTEARTIDTLRKGDIIRIMLEDESGIVPNSSLHADIAYEDEDVVVFDKPAGMAVHPSFNHYDDTLANLFAARYPDCAFRSVNRLDRNTSGLCAVAKNRLAASRLAGNSPDRLQKLYYAVAGGKTDAEGVITAPIARISDSIINREVRADGQYASTRYRTLSSCREFSYLEITLETGRTHQIRVHFSYIGHPLLGDDLYGGSCALIRRHALHCGQITFKQPLTRKEITVTTPLHEDMKQLLTALDRL